jgi:hypothetical protein
MTLILSGDNINEGRIKINSLSGTTGLWTASTGNYSIIADNPTTNLASGDYSFAAGDNNFSSGNTSFSFGFSNVAGGNYSFASGQQTTAVGDYSFTFGDISKAIGDYSISLNLNSQAIGNYSSSFNGGVKSKGLYSHSEGFQTIADGDFSFAAGNNSIASGNCSFVFSENSSVTGDRSVVLGGQNITGTSDDMVYVSKLNINNISDDNNLTNVLTLESNNVIAQKDYNSNVLEMTGDTFGQPVVLEANKFYSYFNAAGTSGTYVFLPLTANTGDRIIVADVNIGYANTTKLTILRNNTYNTPIVCGIGNAVGVELSNTNTNLDAFRLRRGDVFQFTYFGSDVGLHHWVLSKNNTIGKYYGNLINQDSSGNDLDIFYIE